MASTAGASAVQVPVGERAEGTGWVVTVIMPADATLASLRRNEVWMTVAGPSAPA